MNRDALDDLQICCFGGGSEMADRLLAQVLSGRKTAASWPARDGRWTSVGERMIACDRYGRPCAILETTSLQLRRFCDVDAEFACAEGDPSLAWWRMANRIFLERTGGFSEELELWCERFRVVKLLPATDDAPGQESRLEVAA